MQITQAIVRTPCPEIVHGLTTANLGRPDYKKALQQHANYIAALRGCDLEVLVLPPNRNFPDSTFVEDTALLTPKGAVITRPGAPSRRGETGQIQKVLKDYFQNIESIKSPGTIDAGDILQVETHYFIGLSERTNQAGARQIIKILHNFAYGASTIKLKNLLHLKSGVSYLGNNLLAVAGELIDHPAFKHFEQIKISASESYAANSLSINGFILIAAGYPETRRAFKRTGFPVVEIDLSEFRKIDGGLSCLSLRF